MRIIVASPAKTGNVWVKLILAEIYQLRVIDEVPRIPLPFLEAFIAEGGFRDDSILHQHFRPTQAFFELVGTVDARLVTTIRHPYDVFVSLYYYVQRLSHLFQEGTDFYPLIGKSLEDRAVLDYLARDDEGLGFQVRLALEWVECGRSMIVRYEDLLEDPFTSVKGITDRVQPVPDRRIRRAVRNNRAEKLRRKSQILKSHIRKGIRGDWRNHLARSHLEVINAAHGRLIERLGYELHDDPAG